MENTTSMSQGTAESDREGSVGEGRRYQLQMLHSDNTRVTIESAYLLKIQLLMMMFEHRGYRGKLIDTHCDGAIIRSYNGE